ncbi:hypothetical protein F5Y18DRAFT_259597 [Xylariaceae sp. FL1019]|nr:hypothetical protein F5Y18DRAFT_259597 [Xylariaceae sp. FL1019]
MVGIPRSKGCKTCRRKKIKCDEQRPRCGQCRKGVRECEGYEQPTIFLNSSSGDFSSTGSVSGGKAIRFKNNSVDDIAWLHSHGDPQAGQKTVLRTKQHEVRSRPYATKGAKTVPRLSVVPAPRTLGSHVWAVENVLSQFLEICNPSCSTQEAPLAWMRSLVPMKKDVDALPLAMSALAFGWAGHVHSQPQLVDKALQLYNAAVQQLRSDIHACSPLQMLAATAIFVEFELCEFGSKGNSGWQTHMQGIAALLQSLGPEKVSKEPFLQIFSFCRMVFITQGLSRRIKVCAGSPMWTHGPYKNFKKNAYHLFYDLAAEACELLERADALEVPCLDSSVQSERPLLVLRDIVELIRRLWELSRAADILVLKGPIEFPNESAVALNQFNRATARGYPTKIPAGKGWTFDAVQGQRLMHNHWALVLNLYMTILDNHVLRPMLETSKDLRGLLLNVLGTNTPSACESITSLMAAECRKLANNVAIHSTETCHNMCQSFGSLISHVNLESAVQWYEGHPESNGNMETALEQHCRALLRGIRDEESKKVCAFQVSILPDDVLRRHWC